MKFFKNMNHQGVPELSKESALGSVVTVLHPQTMNTFHASIISFDDNQNIYITPPTKTSELDFLQAGEGVMFNVPEEEFEFVIKGAIQEVNLNNIKIHYYDIVAHKNRRKHRRYFLNINGILKIDDRQEVECYLKNISKNGLLISVLTPHEILNVNQKHEFFVKCENNISLELNGTIKRALSSSTRNTVDYGIEINAMSPSSKKTLLSLVDKA